MIHSNLIGDNMKKTIIGTVVILAMLCSLTACANNQPQQNTERETEITNTEPSAEEKNNELTDDSNNNSFSNNAPASVLITCLENGTRYNFRYDKSLLEYDRGGDFHLLGSSATECYLHIIIQDWEEENYSAFKDSNSENILEEFTLSSGRQAFSYSSDIDNTYHIVIDANGIVDSGNGVIKISVGKADQWSLSYKEITEMVDAGF